MSASDEELSNASSKTERSGVLPYEPVDSAVSCVLTRFKIRSPLWLPFFYVAFRRVQREAREQIPGLIKSVFLVESPTVCYTLSLWSDDRSLLQFGTVVTTHVHAANWSFGRLKRFQNKGPELFSAHWSLRSVSNNANWEGVDLKELLKRSR